MTGFKLNTFSYRGQGDGYCATLALTVFALPVFILHIIELFFFSTGLPEKNAIFFKRQKKFAFSSGLRFCDIPAVATIESS
jgi:hypothetical protein